MKPADNNAGLRAAAGEMAKPKVSLKDKLVVAISSRALFDLSASHEIFMRQGIEAYCEYQIEHEEEALAPGSAFPLVRKLLALNRHDPDHPRVEIILLSRNSADTGLRIFNSIQRHDLKITRAAFTGGASPYGYVSAFGAHLFLSTDPEDVMKVLGAGYAAATIIPGSGGGNNPGRQLRLAFDGDAVLFSDQAERVYKQKGLAAFTESEVAAADTPLPGGPFKNFLAALHSIQSAYPPDDQAPIRTALVTARAAPAHKRVIRTLRAWNIRIDEALFLGGMDKADFLRTFGADIFFDDQAQHVDSAAAHVATGHVPHGIANQA